MNTIYILPGMGADHRMYPAPWRKLPDCKFVDWPEYAGEQSLSAVAERVVQASKIIPDSWLVGSSLGGMVCIEIAKIIPVKGVILIGSAQEPTEISAIIRIFSPLISLAPMTFIQQLAGKVPTELTQMFKDSDPVFIRAMCRAILQWDGVANFEVPIYRIHGKNDLVIPLPRKVECAIDGGHLIAMSHAEDCVDLVRNIVTHYRDSAKAT